MATNYYGGRASGKPKFDTGYALNNDAFSQGGVQSGLQRQQAGYQKDRDAAQFGFQTNLAGQRNAAEAAQQAAQLQFGREQLGQQGAISRAQIEASLAPTRFAQQKFNTVFPWVQGQINGLGGNSSGSFGNTAGGFDPRPAISDAPIYSDQQIQGQVNSQRAQNDEAAAGQQRANQQQMAARGFGANSPLAAALNNSVAIGNTATNTANEQDLRWKAASGNATHRLDAQKAQTAQALGYEGEKTKRGIAGQQQKTALLSALLGIV